MIEPPTGGGQALDAVRLPDPATLFDARARRFADLATADHPLAPYLAFLSAIARAQHDGQAGLPAPRSPADGALRRDDLMRAPDLPDAIAWIVDRALIEGAPAAALDARARLAARTVADRVNLAARVLDGTCPAGQLAEGLFVAAALQLQATRAASRLAAATLATGSDRCPACDGPAVSSVVVGRAGAPRGRYLSCGFCGTLWNRIRAQCTSCRSDEGLTYGSLEEAAANLTVELCSLCRTYIKHARHDRDPALDPLADDIATLGLDLKARELGYRRAAANPLMILGDV